MSISEKLRGFVSDTIIYGIGSMLSRGIAFFLIPLYTGYLDKSQYANLILLQLVFAVCSFLLALNSGVFFYYYEYKNQKIKNSVFSSWLAYELVVFVFILIGAFLFYPFISPIFALPEDSLNTQETFFIPFLLIILQLLPFLIYNTYYNLLRIKLNPRGAVLITILDAGLVIGFIVYFLIFAGMGVKGVVLGQLISKSILAIGILLFGFYKYFNPKLVSWAMIKRMVAYSYPFFLSSIFLWIMNGIDKILGTQLLKSQDEVAFLGLAMQITMPAIMLVEVIGQSFGPYVMSIRNESDATQTYKEIFSFTVYIGSLVSTFLIAVSPFLIDILADTSFYPALNIIPLFVMANIINMVMVQFCLGLNLNKKNIYIAVATIIGGIIGFSINLYFQPIIGIKAAGYAQIVAYTVTGIIIYKYSQRFMPINYDLKWALMLLSIMFGSIMGFNSFYLQFPVHPHTSFAVLGGIMLVILFGIGGKKYKVLNLLKKKIKT